MHSKPEATTLKLANRLARPRCNAKVHVAFL
jgi:hypothetical protein